MITRSGVYDPLVKEIYTNITQKNNKDLITIKTTVKRVNINFDRTLLSHIASIPNEHLTITFSSTSCIIFNDDEWKHSKVSHRIGIRPRPNIGHSNDLSPRMRAVSNNR